MSAKARAAFVCDDCDREYDETWKAREHMDVFDHMVFPAEAYREY